MNFKLKGRLWNAQRFGVFSGGLNNSQTSYSQPVRLEPDIFGGVLAAPVAVARTTRI